MRQSLAILLLLASIWSLSTTPPHDFVAPIKGTIQLTGTFGELRGNHFHMGIDIRGGMGVPIYSIGDGYIERIKVEGGGYGQAIYIRHPNGYTSVYGHLDRFVSDIEAYVKNWQYKEESFVQDIYLEPEQFPVKRGQQIAYMGTKGYSFGPHLHFEIRRTRGDIPLNPLAFGFKVADRRKPQLRELRLYRVMGRGDTETESTFSLQDRRNGRYSLRQDTLRTRSEAVGLAIKAYDQMDGLSNLNGIHQLQMFVDDSLHFQFQFDAIPNSETRYLNAHLDYEDQQKNNSWFHRCFRLPGNQASIYDPSARRGVLRLRPGQARNIRIESTDFAGNRSELAFTLLRERGSKIAMQSRYYNYLLPYDEESVIDNGEMQLSFRDSSLYQDLYLEYDLLRDGSTDVYSSVHHLGKSSTPIHRSFQIGILPNFMPEALREKAFIAYCPEDGNPSYAGGQWGQNGYLQTSSRQLGNYCIMVDTIAPKIDAFDFSSNMRGWSRMRFRIRDDIPGSPLQYRASVDGQWILMEYDAKNNRLIHTFDGRIERGTHEFLLEVEDARGNVAAFSRSFRY